MDSTNENLFFTIESMCGKHTFYKHELQLKSFQKKTLNNENVSFFYTFKDMAMEVEENILKKISLNNSDSNLLFIIRMNDKVLYSYSMDIGEINESVVEKNEVDFYFIFEKSIKQLVDYIAKSHQDIVLSNVNEAGEYE